MKRFKKIVIITSSILVILVILSYLSLEYIGGLIFDSLIENEYNSLNEEIDRALNENIEDININVDVSNSSKNEPLNNESGKDITVPKNETENNSNGNSNNDTNATSNQPKNDDENVAANTNDTSEGSNVNNQANLNNEVLDDNSNTTIIQTEEKETSNPLSNINENSQDYSNLEEYLDEDTKQDIQENDKSDEKKVFESETIKNVKDSVENKDKIYVATKVLTKLSKKQLADLMSMISGGITLDEKIEAIKIVKSAFDEDEVEKIRDIYHKYTDQLENQ